MHACKINLFGGLGQKIAFASGFLSSTAASLCVVQRPKNQHLEYYLALGGNLLKHIIILEKAQFEIKL